MINLKSKSILLFTPGFFNYDDDINQELVRRGAAVYHYNERGNPNNFQKIILRKYYLLDYHRILQYYKKIIHKHRNEKIDYVVFINPEAVNQNIIKILKEIFPNAVFMMYMWDSLNNKNRTTRIIPYFDKAFTFDKTDADKNDLLIFRPLFYRNVYYNHETSTKNAYDLSFIGTIHSDRYEILRKIQNLENKNIYYFLYFPSRMIYFYYKLINQTFRKTKMREFRFKALNDIELLDILQSSDILIDIHHPYQKGLTIRTIESIGLKKKLITTNSDIKNYEFYNPNICIIDRNNPVIPASFYSQKYVELGDNIYYKYSIAGWIDDLFKD